VEESARACRSKGSAENASLTGVPEDHRRPEGSYSVRRPLARRRGGAALPTAGFLSIGVSATLLVVIGSRVLSAPAFSGLFVAWTIVNVFGFGIGTPTEQLISRRMNAAAPGSLRPALFRLLLAALIGAAVTIGLALGSPQAHNFPLLVPSALIAIVGWTAVVVVRGRLAGSGDLLGYAAVLGVESVARTLLLAACLVLPGQAMTLMAAAVAVPVLLAAALGALVVIPQVLPLRARSASVTSNGSAPDAGYGDAREQMWFVMYSVGYQVCLQAAVLLLGWRAGESRSGVVGAFGAANSYFRTPTVLMGGITTHALVMLSRAWGAADLAGMRTALRVALRNGLLVGLGGTVLLGLVAPVVLPIYYHHKLGLPISLMAGLAVSTVITVMAAVLVQPLLAAGRGATAGLAWVAGGATTVVMFALSSGTDRLATAALICGPLLALAIAIVAVWRLVHTNLARPSPPTARIHTARVTDSPVE
jgi:O-antigen/teichoic acid export membrane protein